MNENQPSLPTIEIADPTFLSTFVGTCAA